MRTDRHIWDTTAEADAFYEGIILVKDSSLTAEIDDENQRVVITYDESGEDDLGGEQDHRSKEKKWTIVLQYPDYGSGDYSGDIYVGWAECDDPYDAVPKVQQLAAEANPQLPVGPEGYKPVLVLPGHITAQLDATNF